MASFLEWPYDLLQPSESQAVITPFSRSGGPSLGGVQSATRTDLGWWNISLTDVPLMFTEQRRTFDAISQILGGRSGVIAVPAWSIDTAPYLDECYPDPQPLTPHSDMSPFSDDSLYSQDAISVVTVGQTAIGSTVITLKLISGASDLSGIRFSYQHALYQTGQVVEVNGDEWKVRITPTIRAVIPDGAELSFDRPTCLCRLVEDAGMARASNGVKVETVTVNFVEATDVWNRLAIGLDA